MSWFPQSSREDEFPTISTYCVPACASRAEAVRLRLMQWAKRYNGWVFPDCRDREVTRNGRSLIAKHSGENHHGEPVVYAAHDGNCPWCGRILPAPPDADQGEGPE